MAGASTMPSRKVAVASVGFSTVASVTGERPVGFGAAARDVDASLSDGNVGSDAILADVVAGVTLVSLLRLLVPVCGDPPGPGGQDTAEFTKIRDKWIKKHYNSRAFQDEIRVQITNGSVLLKAGKEYQAASPMEQVAMEKDLKMQMHNAMKGKATSDFGDPIARGFARGSEFDPARKMGSGLYAL